MDKLRALFEKLQMQNFSMCKNYFKMYMVTCQLQRSNFCKNYYGSLLQIFLHMTSAAPVDRIIILPCQKHWKNSVLYDILFQQFLHSLKNAF